MIQRFLDYLLRKHFYADEEFVSDQNSIPYDDLELERLFDNGKQYLFDQKEFSRDPLFGRGYETIIPLGKNSISRVALAREKEIATILDEKGNAIYGSPFQNNPLITLLDIKHTQPLVITKYFLQRENGNYAFVVWKKEPKSQISLMNLTGEDLFNGPITTTLNKLVSFESIDQKWYMTFSWDDKKMHYPIRV